MVEVTIISDDVRTVDATVSDGRILLDPATLPDSLGWELKPEGLCRDDVCVPVRDPRTLFADDRLDLERVADALGRPVVVDADARLASIALRPGGAPSRARLPRRALVRARRPQRQLHRLEEWHGRKRLLVAFASW